MSNKNDPRVVLAGSVSTTRRTLQAMLRHQVNLVGVLGLNAQKSVKVSGYARLDDLAGEANIPYFDFENINAPGIVSAVQQLQPDLLFVVGLSQMVNDELLAAPKLACVGFHPTHLPEGRGRAPVAWLAYESRNGAATFFVMEAGADSGAILAQELFLISAQDYASDVTNKMELAIDRALDDWLPRMVVGEWVPISQDHAQATFYGRRAPADGLISWEKPATEIQALVRASSRPHPGAYTYARHHKLLVWRAELETELVYRGVIGRVLEEDDEKGYLVQTGEGLLWLSDLEFENPAGDEIDPLRVGMKLGYTPQDEIYRLRGRIAGLEERLSKLEAKEDK